MSFQTVTSLVGLNAAHTARFNAARAARGVVGLLIAASGLVILIAAVMPWASHVLHAVMNDPLKARAVGDSLIAGAATGLGGLALLVMRKIDQRGLGLFMAIAAGMMAAAACVSLLLPAVRTEGALDVALAAAFAGYGLMALLDQTLPHEHPVQGLSHAGDSTVRTALLMTVAIAIHNLPEGFAVGASAGALPGGSSGTALSIGLQNIPEGLIVATALWSIGLHKAVAATVALLTGLVEPVGAAVGTVVSEVWAHGTPASMAFAAGAMAFVVLNEMLPESINMTGRITTYLATGLSTVATALALGWMGA